MKLRARHVHAIEALVDNIVGFFINMALVALVFNALLGYNISLHDNFKGGIIFFVIAWIRKYTIRRWSSRFIQWIYKNRS